MANNERGYTLIEVVIAVAVVAWLGFAGWLLSLVIRALMKYIGS